MQCLDYIFYSAGLVAKEVLSIPLLTDLKGETPGSNTSLLVFWLMLYFMLIIFNPAEPLTAADPTHLEPFSCCSELFDNKLNKILSDLKLKRDSQPSRHAVNELKRKLKDQLSASYQNTGSSPNGDFWGGRWSPLVTQNTERINHFLPNDSFCSTHLAIGAKLSSNTAFLASQWR